MKTDLSKTLKSKVTDEQLKQQAVEIRAELETLSQQPVAEINRDELVDIRSVHIDPDEPIATRMLRYLNQINNPYCFLVGDIVVRVGFNEKGKSLDEAFHKHLNT